MSPLFKYTLRSITSRPLNALFLAGSMALVAFTLSSLSAVGIGLRDVFRTSESESLVLVTSKGVLYEDDSNLPLEKLGRITADARVRGHSAERLIATALVPDPGSGDALDYLDVRGIDPDGFTLHGATLVSGRMPSKEGEELLVGDSLLRHYPRLAVGRTLDVHRKYHFTIVGVYHTGTPLDDELWTWRDTLARRQTGDNQTELSVVYLQTGSPDDARALAHDLTETHGLGVMGVVPPAWRRHNAEKAFGPLYNWLLLVISLVAAGAVLAATGVLTILFLRRSTDMSVLRAIGYRLPRIARLVIVEIELVAVGGGAFGLLVAALVTRGLALQAAGPGVGVNFVPSVTPFVLGATIGAVALLAVVASVWPILRLARTPVQDGLR